MTRKDYVKIAEIISYNKQLRRLDQEEASRIIYSLTQDMAQMLKVDNPRFDTDKFMVTDKMQEYVDAGGEILACGTCLKIRNSGGSEMCSLTTMQDLYDLINESDKVISI